MYKFLAHSPRYYYYTLAAIVVLIAVLLQSLRLLAPQVDRVRPSIVQFLSTEINADVSLGRISATWYGLRPHVLVNNIAISDGDGKKLLSVDKADFTVDILASLFRFQWVWAQVALDEIYLDVRQGEGGQWKVAGFPVGGNDRHYYSPKEIFESVSQISVNNADVQLTFSNNKVVRTTIPSVQIENAGDFHRLTAAASIQGEETFSLVLERQGARGEEGYSIGYLQLKEFPLNDIAEGFLPDHNIAINDDLSSADISRQSTINGTWWFDFKTVQRVEFVGNFSLSGLAQTTHSKQHLLNIPVAANVRGSYGRAKGWSIGLRDIMVDNTQRIEQLLLQQEPQKALRLMIDSVSLKAWASWVDDRFTLPKKIGQAIAEMALDGSVDNIIVDVNKTNWQKSTLSANLVDVSSSPSSYIPGIDNVNGYIETNLHKGFVNVETNDFKFFPKKIYQQALHFDHIKGQMAWLWEPKNKRVTVNSGAVKVSSSFGEGNGYFLANIPWGGDDPKSNFILQLGIKNSSVEHYQQFVPKKLPKALTHWLSTSLGAGNISQTGFIYRGGSSGENNTRSLQLFLDAEETEISFSPDWPTLQEATAKVLVDDEYAQLFSTQAKMLDEPIDKLRVTWQEYNKKELNVRLNTDLPAITGLRLLKETWLRTKVGNSLDAWSATGDMSLDVNVNVPLLTEVKAASTNSKQLVKVTFKNNEFQSNTRKLNIQAVKGFLFYSNQRGLYSDGLSVSLFGNTLPLSITQLARKSSSDSLVDGEYLSITGDSFVNIKPLSEWMGISIFPQLSGGVAYNLNIRVPTDKKSRKYSAKLSLSSNLKGLSSDLPVPFAKNKNQLKSFELTGWLKDNSTKYVVQLGDDIRAEFDGSNRSGVLLVGRTEELLSPPFKVQRKETFSVRASLKEFSVGQWFNFLSSWPEPKKNTLKSKKLIAMLNFDIDIEKLSVRETVIDNVSVVGKRIGNIWDAHINNKMIDGGFIVDDTFATPIKVDLNHFIILGDGVKKDLASVVVDPLAEMDFSLVKTAKINVKNLYYKDTALGGWDFMINPIKNGVRVDDIRAEFSQLSLTGINSAGASLIWSEKGSGEFPAQRETIFKGVLAGAGIHHLFKDFGFPPLIESKTTDIAINVAWNGSPAFFSMDKLRGNMQAELKDGLFVQNETKASTGVLRLFGLFNFNTWARRLKLDFSDLYKKGVVFDRITSRFLFDQGWIYFQEPLQMKSPSSKFTMAGKIDYVNENIDGVLVTTLPVGGNLTFVAALAAGLPAAAGVYIVSKIFKPQVDKVSSLTYSIKGNWSDPEVKFLNIFNNRSAENEEKSQSAISPLLEEYE